VVGLARVSVRVGLLALLTSAGCQAFFGVDDYEPGPDGPPSNAASGAGRGGGGGDVGSGGGGPSSTGSTGGGGAMVDPTCVCLDAPPAGWAGPFAVYSTDDPEPPLGQCTDGPLYAKYFDGAPGPAICNPCTCSPPPTVCSGPTLICYGATTCSGTPQDWTAQATSASCYGYADQNLACKVQGTPTASVVGACPPAGGEKTLPPWKSTHAVCNLAPSPGGCADGTCYLKAAGSRVCIVHEGAHMPCPDDGWTQIKAYTGQDEQRSCSACSCGPASAATCSPGTYTFYTDGNCIFQPLDAKTTCQQMSPFGFSGESVHYSPGSVAQAATCVAAGGIPGGTFTGTGEATLCCKE
jgi:hypothetical protein